ncbi:MAG: ABC transporter substrate-binding protein [Anaerolineaceae bacterium]|nr:ABC transporter substrate-binding protein [Anaerolineaceae bacterium]
MKTRSLFIIVMITASLTLSACQRTSKDLKSAYPIGSLWSVPANEDVLDWQNAAPIANEQHSGSQQASEDISDVTFTHFETSEGNLADDIQVSIRKLVEEDKVTAMLGATTNEASMRTASLVNFFEVPMLIPSADGTNLMPSTNLWAFRLSPPGSSYADFVFTSLLTKGVLGEDGEELVDVSDQNIAILFEQNTFGESAAVATAQGAMEQMMHIVMYESFTTNNPDPDSIKALVSQVKDAEAQIVYMISSDPMVAKTLISTFQDVYDKTALPVMIGQAGGFASDSFLKSWQAEDVFVVRQKLDVRECPSEIDSIYAAQYYAAESLLAQAVVQVNLETPEKWSLKVKNPLVEDKAQFRESVRDVIKASNGELPCLGKVSFDNSGQNKNLQFEILTVKEGKTEICTIEEFQEELE